MKVILNSFVKGLGRRGDIVNVKPGYFRNFLFPRGLAMLATKALLKVAEERLAARKMNKEEMISNAKSLIDQLAGITIKLEEKANEQGHLYASVSETEIVEALNAQHGIDLAQDFLQMKAIKELGNHKVGFKFDADLVGEFEVTVTAA
jgi:large subunit ribosomal protein L9